jgi:type IV conjugative transfer system lipoprotein TraV
MVGKIKILLLLVALNGCSSYQGNIKKSVDCGFGAGASCKSVTEVNKMVSEGSLGGNDKLTTTNTSISQKSPKLLINESYLKDPNKFKTASRENQENLIRLPEQTARIWINSFEDETGDYVKETYVYTVLENGKWENVQ